MKGLLFTYALTYGGAVASIFNPFYGLLVYISFAIIRPELLWWYSVPPGNYSRIVAVALLIGWALRGFGNWNLQRGRPILLALIAYWCCIVISALNAANQQVAWDYVELHTKILLPVLVGLTLVDTPQRLRAVAWVMVGSLSLLAFEGNLDHFRGGFMIRLDGIGGMDNNSICIAMVLGAGLAFFLGLAETKWWTKLAAFACSGMMVHVPIFGNSRGGMLGLCVLAVVSFWLIPKRPAYVGAFALGLAIALRLAGPAAWERFETAFASEEERDASAESRLDLWRDGWDVMQKHPLTGAGPNHWPLLAASYGWTPGKEMHSLWFNAGAELGLTGLAALLGMYSSAIYFCVRLILGSSDPHDWAAHGGRMTVAGLVGFMVAASFVSLDALEPPYHMLIIAGGSLRLASFATPVWLDTSTSRFNLMPGIGGEC